MANLLNFLPDEQLIILYEMSNSILVKALARYSGTTQEELRVKVLQSVQKQIPKMKASSLNELIAKVRATRDSA